MENSYENRKTLTLTVLTLLLVALGQAMAQSNCWPMWIGNKVVMQCGAPQTCTPFVVGDKVVMQCR